MRFFAVASVFVFCVSGCSFFSLVGGIVRCEGDANCAADERCSADGFCVADTVGEGEGEVIVGEGEGDVIVGEGEGDVIVGEGEGEVGEGEGDVIAGEGEGEVIVVGEGEGEVIVVGEGEGEGEVCDPIAVDSFNDDLGRYGSHFGGGRSSAAVGEGSALLATPAGAEVSYAGFFEEGVHDYRGLVVEIVFHPTGINGPEESYLTFDSNEASVLLFSGADGTGISAREPNPSFVTFDAAIEPSIVNTEVRAQLRFDGPVVKATINGAKLTLTDAYTDILGDAEVNFSAGCFDACDGLSVAVDEISVWPACRR